MTRKSNIAASLGVVATLISHSGAFSSVGVPSRQSSLCTTGLKRHRPLHAFEVVAEVGAVVESTQAMSSAVALPSTSASMSSAINSFFQTQPYLAAFLTCSFKASAADMVAQSQEESAEVTEEGVIQLQAEQSDVDLSRNMGFLLYGGLYQGMAQNYLYSVVYPALVGTGEGWGITATKVMVDNFFFAPFLCLPIAYVFKTAFTSDELNMGTFTQSLEKYAHDVMNNGLLIKYWSLWIPVQFLTFGVIPEHFRVAFVAFISFFWICVLSTVVSSNQQQEQ